MFIRYLWEEPRSFFAIAFMVIFSVCCHEYMHALTALKMGDDTAARNGHLTLNPLKQMGIWSLFTLFLIGIAWGQVPVNPANFRSRGGRVFTALVGPLTNFVLWIIFTVACIVTLKSSGNEFASQMLLYGAVLNFVLFIFNLLPIPGLDGFTVLQEFIPSLFRTNSEMVKGTFFVITMMLFIFISKLFALGGVVTAWLLIGLEKVFV